MLTLGNNYDNIMISKGSEQMKHLGDITKISGHDVPIVDIVTGGSPCQDLSVAGKREGLAGERSGLFMEQIRIIKEMREESGKTAIDIRHIRPRYMVWENVQGAFSSNKGEDFRAVLEETAKIVDKNAIIPGPKNGKWSPSGCIMGDGWSIAWRLHDAQFWGVPQRRKRISLVADFAGGTAPEILFERESMSGNTEPSGETRQGTSTDTKGCVDTTSYTLKVRGGSEFDRYGHRAGKGALIQEELSGTLGVSQDQTLITNRKGEEPYTMSKAGFFLNGRCDGKADTLVATDYKDPQSVCYSQNAYDKYAETEKGASLKASGGNYGGGTENIVIQ